MSCNLLNMKAALRESGTSLSEASSLSERGRGFLSDSREELRDLVAILGLAGVEDLHQDRFRIDRKKLEHMILGDDEAPEPADTFFHKIMEETNTVITWPARLKIGARSKKDPHIRVVGLPEDVKVAKDKILVHLDSRSNRVTMKMDVSYTDHSHIIGKGGLRIKHVMNETHCHIHFPDSNRSNPTEKSNQVSIAGDIFGVENARARIRKLTPLIFSFELPIMGCSQTPPDVNSPYIVRISQQYNVEVMFRTRPKLHATLVLVKGAEREVDQVKEATMLLINHMCDAVASQILVQMTMEISPIHHPIVVGKGGSYLKTIMQRTSTQIMFPEASDPNIPTIKKSNVTITGVINDVYAARQLLMGSLPLVLMFDLPENVGNISTERITEIMSKFDVFINIRQKPKQNTLGVVIKGIERNATNIYDARYHLLSLNEVRIIAEIPDSYHFSSINSASNQEHNQSTFSSFQSESNSNTNFLSSRWAPLSTTTPSLSYTHTKPYPFTNQSSNSLLQPFHTPGYLGVFPSMSVHSEDTAKDSAYSSANNSLSPASSPRRLCSPVMAPPDTSTNIDLATMFSNMRFNEIGLFGTGTSLANLDQNERRLAAAQAMQNSANGYRVPNSTWVGYGLSATSPTLLENDKTKDIPHSTVSEQDDDVWAPTTNHVLPSTSNLNTSNFMEHSPTHTMNRLTSNRWKDLPSLLVSLNLEKYVRIFTSHEIDLTTFSTLTDKDLIEIGISAFGARRKILLAVSELKKRTTLFSGSAAPGAERKSSPSTPSSCRSTNKGW